MSFEVTKSKRWYVHLPGAVYANGPVYFPEPISAEEFKAWVREWLGVDRVLPGTGIWPVGDFDPRGDEC